MPRRGSGWGFTLIEATVVLVFVSVMVALVLNGSGGIPGSRGNGTSNYPTVSSASKYMTQRYLASSSLLESAMSGRIIGYNTDNSQVKVLPPPGEGEEEGTPGMDYDKDMLFEIDPATPITTARAAYDEDGHTYFDWEIRDCSYTYDEYNDEYTFAVPEGNRLLCLTLRVYESQTATTPWRTFQAKIFVNDFDPETEWGEIEPVGVVFAIDTSDTMRKAKTSDLWLTPNTHVTSPYLKYLQDRYPGTVDITFSMQEDNAATSSYFEDFLGPDTKAREAGPRVPTGFANGDDCTRYQRCQVCEGPADARVCHPIVCDQKAEHYNCQIHGCTDSSGYTQQIQFFIPCASLWEPHGEGCALYYPAHPHVDSFCRYKWEMSWDNLLDNHMSRIELARSSLLALLIQLENSLPADYLEYVEAGLISFDDTPRIQISLSGNGLTLSKGDLTSVKNRLFEVNRSKGTSCTVCVTPSSSKNLYAAAQTLETMLGENLSSGFVVLSSDLDSFPVALDTLVNAGVGVTYVNARPGGPRGGGAGQMGGGSSGAGYLHFKDIAENQAGAVPSLAAGIVNNIEFAKMALLARRFHFGEAPEEGGEEDWGDTGGGVDSKI